MKTDWKLLKTRAIPSLKIFPVTVIVSFVLSYFLQKIGVYRSANTIRREIVQHLSENSNNSEGQPVEYFAGLPWSRYLHNMAQSRMHCDYNITGSFKSV